MSFTSAVFEKERIGLGDTEESIVRGGRHLFARLPEALKGVRRIGVIGWSSQAPAQALNFRESLDGSDIKVTVGLRAGSPSWSAAEAAGFTAANGTLGEMYDVIAQSDLVLLLISDAAQVENYDKIIAALRFGGDTRPLAWLPPGPSRQRRKILPAKHQRDRRLPQGHGTISPPPLRAGP